MATLFTCQFVSQKNITWTINIDDADHVGAATDIEVAADGFSLSYDGEENPLQTIVGSRCKVTAAVSSSTETALQGFASDLQSAAEERFTMEIRRNAGTDQIFWCGYILADLSGFEDMEPPYGFAITAVDGISRLKDVEYKDDSGANDVPYGFETFLTHILNCLTQGTLHTTYYTTSDQYLRTSVNWVDSVMGAPTETECPLAQTRVNGEVFARPNRSNNAEEWTFDSCYEVLDKILGGWQCRMLMSDGAYRIEQVAERAQDTHYERRFAYDETLLSSTSVAAHDITIQQDTVNEKLAGNNFDYLPPVSSVLAKWEHVTVKNQIEGLGGKWMSGTAAQATRTISDVTFNVGTKIYLSAEVSMDVDLNDTYTTPWRYVIAMRLYKNGQYLKSNTFSVQDGQGNYLQQVDRDPITIHPSFAAYEISSAFSVNDEVQHTEIINLQLNNISGGAGDLTITFALLNAYELDETAIVGEIVNFWSVTNPALYIVDSTDPDSFLDNERLYEGDNPDAGNANILEFDMYFGSNVQGWTVSRLQTYNGSSWEDSGDDWDRDTNANDHDFGQLWVEQAISLMRDATKTYTGQFLTKALMPHSRAVFDYDDSAWLMLSGTFQAREHVFQGVWMSAGTNETDVTPGPPIKKGLSPTGNPFTTQMRRLPGRFDPTAVGLGANLGELGIVALTANFIGSTISSGSITSLPVRESIPENAFLANDNIFVVNPKTGKTYPFTVSTDSDAGDTSIAVNSLATSEDIPTGCIVLYSVMNKMTQTGGTTSELPNVVDGAIILGVGTAWQTYVGVTDGHVLTWNSSSGTWEAQAPSGGGGSVSGDINHLAYFDTASSVTSDTNTLYWNPTTNRLGIGTTGPYTDLGVDGAISVGDSMTASNTIRALNLISTDAVMRILRVSANVNTASPSIELIHRTSADGADSEYWDIYPSSTFLGFRDRNSSNAVRMKLSNSGYNAVLGDAAINSSYGLLLKQAGSTDGLAVQRSSSTAAIGLYHNGSATVESIGGLNLKFTTAANSLLEIRPGGGSAQIRQVLVNPNSNITTALGNGAIWDFTGTYAPTTAGGDFSMLRLGTTINQTGSADQVTRGLYINPTLTALASAGFRAIEWPSTSGHFLYQGGSISTDSYHRGNIVFGGSSDNPGAKVDISGDTSTSASDSLRVRDSSNSVILHVRDDSRVGILTSSPSVTLDAATATDGIALPEGTTAQRPSVNNSIRINSTAEGLEVRQGAKWHRLTSQDTPTIAAGAAAGTGPTVSVTLGNDLVHSVSLTVGTSPLTGVLFTVTFGTALEAGLATLVQMTPTNSNASAANTVVYVSTAANSSYQVSTSFALTASTTYTWAFHVKQ